MAPFPVLHPIKDEWFKQMTRDVHESYGAEDSAYLRELLHILAQPWIRSWKSEQHVVLTTCCLVLCIGTSILALNAVYHFLPTAVRLFAVPALLYGAYHLGLRVVAPYIFGKFQI